MFNNCSTQCQRLLCVCVIQAIVIKALTLRNLENALTQLPLTLSTISSLGRALQVPEHKITEFKTNNPRDIANVRTEILHYWLSNGVCSWGAVTGALYTIGERQIAEQLRSEYIYCPVYLM